MWGFLNLNLQTPVENGMALWIRYYPSKLQNFCYWLSTKYQPIANWCETICQHFFSFLSFVSVSGKRGPCWFWLGKGDVHNKKLSIATTKGKFNKLPLLEEIDQIKMIRIWFYLSIANHFFYMLGFIYTSTFRLHDVFF